MTRSGPLDGASLEAGSVRPAPLSYGQELLWVLDRLAPGIAQNHVPPSRRVRGPLDTGALSAALSALRARHEVLRTTFHELEAGPVQVVESATAVPLEEIDLTLVPPAERDAAVQEILENRARRPIDLAVDSMLRAHLIRLGPEDHVLLLLAHRMAADAQSGEVLWRDLAALYELHTGGAEASLPGLPLQYADFASWQRQRSFGGELEWWRAHLEGAPSLLDLPLDRPRTPVCSYRGAQARLDLSAPLQHALSELGRETGATMLMTLTAGLAVVVGRHAGTRDLVLGTPFAGRENSEVRDLIGLFANTVLLRIDLTGEPSFRELLGRVRRECQAAFPHHEIPIELLSRHLRPERSLPHAALCQVFVGMEAAAPPVTRMGELRLEKYRVHGRTARSDLTLDAAPSHEGLRIRAGYDRDLFDPATIGGILGHLDRVLQSAVDRPDCPVERLSMMSAAEWSLVVPALTPPRSFLTVERSFREQVALRPDAVAVEQDGVCMTYAALAARVRGLAAQLATARVGPGDRVGLLARRSPDLVAAQLAIASCGAAVVAVDPDSPLTRTQAILRDARPRALLVERGLGHLVPPAEPAVLYLDEAAADGPASCAAAPADDDPAYVIYTSGSSGEPKGVVVGHGALAAFVEVAAEQYGIVPGQRVLQFASCAFDASIEEIFCTLTQGATLVLRTAHTASSARAFVADCAAWRVTIADLPTSFWHELVAQATEESLALPACLRRVIIGGERALPERLAAWWALAGGRVELLNTYGPTEATVVATIWRAGAPLAPGREVPIGAPLPGVETWVLDEALESVPPGVPGELCLGGRSIALGYLGKPALTAERFVPHHQDPGRRLYRTGDRVRRLPGGELEFMGRYDAQIKLRGYRIEPAEVERALREHPAIKDVVVRLWTGDGPGPRLAAWLVARDGERPGLDELRAALKSSLPAWMIPTAWAWLERLPRGSAGKVDSAALPAPDAGGGKAAEHVAPVTPLEELVETAMSRVLHLERVARHDDFFALGGDSLLATRVLARLREAVGIELPLAALFEHPTVAGLSRIIEATMGRRSGQLLPPVERVPRDGELPLSQMQRQLWLIEELEPDAVRYNVTQAYRLRGELDPGALGAAVDALHGRHEALRSIVVSASEELVQRIGSPATGLLEIASVSDLPAGEREPAALARAMAEGRCPFDRTAGRLLRALLIELDARDHVLVFTAHHSAVDGWSMGLLMQELAAGYRLKLQGLPPDTAATRLGHVDFAAWQARRRAGGEFEPLTAWWAEQLAGAELQLELPVAPPPAGESASRSAGRVLRTVDRTTAGRVASLARAQGATPFLVLLAAWQIVLLRMSGQRSVVVGCPVAGRSRVELEEVVGCLVNMLPHRVDLSDGATFEELLRNVRESALAAWAHQDVPFADLVEALKPARDRHPIFQAAFVLQNVGQEALELQGIDAAPVEVEANSAKFELVLVATEDATGLSLVLEHDRRRITGAVAEVLMDAFTAVLSAALARPSTPVTELPILSPEERRRVVEEFNDTAVEYPSSACIHDLFREQAALAPDAVAVALNDQVWTYGQLRARSDAMAVRLQELGVGLNVRVGVCLERSSELVVALLGVLAAGGCYVAIDPSHPAERLVEICRDAEVHLIVTQQSLVPSVSALGAPVILVEDVSSDPDARPRPSGATAGDLAYVCYTSGSTGRPKGVAVSHRGVVRLVRSQTYVSFDARHVFMHFSPLAFDASTVELWGPLLNGASVALVPPGAPGLDGIAATLQRHRVTSAFFTTGLFNLVVDERLEALQGVEQVLFGGEAASPAHIRRARASLPNCLMVNGYGPTECTTLATALRVEPGAAELTTVSIGRPLANTRAYVLDAHAQPLPVGVAGELYLAGDGVAWGYLARPDLTAERFVPDPFGSGRVYRTGDRARWMPDGCIEFLGRLDHQVKIRGFRVEPGEIEECLRSHPGVVRCVVSALPDASGTNRLVAWVVAPAAEGLEHRLREWVRARLPEFMVPSAVVRLDSLPLDRNGKVDRRALSTPTGSHAARTAPRDELESSLVAIWEEVLGVRPISVHDRFFDIGGHSLLAMKLAARIEAALGHHVPQLTLFEAQTIAELAARLRRGVTPVPGGLLVPLQPLGDRPPFFWIHSLGGDRSGSFMYYRPLARLLGPNQPSYGIRAPEVPHRRLGRMAAEYVEAIAGFYPRGPVLLGGFCFGGNVAFEVARQLRATGREVALLALIESAPPEAKNAMRGWLRRGGRWLRQLLGREARVTEPSAIWNALDRDVYPPDCVEFAEAHWEALHATRPEPYEGEVVVFREISNSESDYGWGRLAARGAVTVELPGDHQGVVQRPAAEILAATLTRMIAARLGNRTEVAS